LQLVNFVRCVSIIIYSFFFNNWVIYSQWVNEPFHAFGTLPFLNADCVKKAQISHLNGKIYTKLPGEMIVKTEGFVKYQFNSLGQTISMVSYRPYLTFKDSICYFFKYSEGHLIEIKTIRKKDYTIQLFTYSNDKLVNSEEHIGLLSTGKEIQTNSLLYSYYNMGDDRYTIVSYKSGNPYKQIRKSYDSLQHLTFEESIDYISQDTITTQYTYDANANLILKQINGGARIEETSLIYQSNKELEAIKHYRNGELKDETQIIYHNGNQALSSVIHFDHLTKLMEIIRF